MPERPPRLRAVDFDPFAAAPAAPPPPVELPLTEPQREMWLAASMSREASCSYNQCYAFTLRGPLRVESLKAALDEVVARHDGLRATIAPDGSSQRLRAPFSVELPVKDLSRLDADGRQRAIDELLETELGTPFDLVRGPLLRASVVRESADRHRFVFTAHHLVCDGWSSSVLFADLGRLYAADCVGIPAQLPPAASYRAYVAGETSPEHGVAAATDEDYWADQFPGRVPVLDLPLERARPPVKTYRSAQEVLAVDGELYAALKKTGLRSGATLFATLLAAFEVLVYRLSGQTDFVVGIPLAGQLQLEDPALVAHCVSTVPLRSRVDPAAGFAAHLRAARERLAEAQEHGRLTFGSLLGRLDVARDRSRTPLLAITFNIDKLGAPFDFGDVTIESLATPRSYSNFELMVNAVDSGRDLRVECDHNLDLFPAATIRRWLSHYRTLLADVVARPDRPLDSVSLLDETDKRALLAAPATAFAGATCLHRRFEEQVRRNPDAVAAVYEGAALTYGALNRRANQLAHELRARGVRRDDLVGLCTDRSLELVVGILGILKAGGAYLPLDPSYPPDRLRFLLDDAAVRTLVTQEGHLEVLGAPNAVCLDRDRAALDARPDTDPVTDVGPDHLAYVIYTSGSTGKPKGVLVTHRNVARLFEATDAWFGFGAGDAWTLFHSFAFDFSVWELWGALLYGGRLVVVPYWVSRSPESFHELLRRERVTVLNQTPSAFRQLIQADLAWGGPPGELALRTVIFGGEALELQALRPWLRRHGDARPRLVNMYGITETTVHVTYRPIGLADVEGGAGSVIGVPIPDLELHVLDGHGEPTPIGVTGELHVGGAGLARGYLNRPQLTAERFIRHPFSSAPEARLYRSGDLARRLSDGDLEYLGRMDTQVKIRGFRIELGEIEAALAAQPGVREACVLLREDTPGDPRLVAYVAGDDAAATDRLRAALRERLPDYMVPAHFIALAKIPLTPNGKVDRKALPAPESGPRPASAFVAPRTPTEERVAAIFAEALGVPAGSDDNFFDLGGHSMKAVQVVNAIRASLGVELALRHLFERPTVAGLAQMVDLLGVAAAQTPADAGREEVEI